MGACRRQCRRETSDAILHRARPGRTADRGVLRATHRHCASPPRVPPDGRPCHRPATRGMTWAASPRYPWGETHARGGLSALVPKGASASRSRSCAWPGHRPRPRRAAPTGSEHHRQPAWPPPPADQAGPVLPEAVALFTPPPAAPMTGWPSPIMTASSRTAALRGRTQAGGKWQAPLTLAGGMPAEDDGPYPARALDERRHRPPVLRGHRAGALRLHQHPGPRHRDHR